MNMKEAYEKSLQMIKILNIKTEREYIRILRDYLLLSLPSLKYISAKKNFDDIIELAKKQCM